MVFRFQDVVKEFPGESHSRLRRTLAIMVGNGMLCKLSRNIYHIVPLAADPGRYEPDGRVVAKYIMQAEKYYIGYTTALRIHGLSTQDTAKVYVVTEKPMKPTVREIRGTTYQFISHHSDRIFGFRDIWINHQDQVKVSDLEKTIVDMASNPSPLESIIDFGKAIFKARNRTDYDKLFYYFSRNGNRSAIKRYLYLVDLLSLEWTSGHELMMNELGTGTSVLDPKGNKHGKNAAKFGLKINVDPDLLKKGVLQ